MPADTFEFTMPSLGADMDEGKLIEWLVKPGDEVKRGDIVAAIETAKATIEVECFHPGTVDHLIVDPGTTVPVGAPLATLISEAASVPAPVEPVGTAAAAPSPAASMPADSHEQRSSAGPLIRKFAKELDVDLGAVRGTGRNGQATRADVRRAAERRNEPAKISEYARRLAEQLEVDLATVSGTGRQGAIRTDDIRAAASASSTAAEPAKTEGAPEETSAATRARTMRLATGALMARSKREIPHYYVSTTADVTQAFDWLREHNGRQPVGERILPAALFLRAAVLAAVQVPELNGHWVDDDFVPGDGVNLGVAVSLRGGGLITPALAHAENLKLTELGAEMRDLATRAKAGRLRGSEMTAGTITVTNLGDLGVETVYGVIYPPQVAIVGVGKVVARPWAVDGLLGVRSVATLTLSADHRATDGHAGARYLDVMNRSLSRPDQL